MVKTQSLSALSEEFVEIMFRQDPVAATGVGIHDYDALLPDESPEGIEKRLSWLRDYERRLEAQASQEDESAGQRVDRALLHARVEGLKTDLELLRMHERNPVRYAQSALDGVFVLYARPFAPLDERKEPILARMMAIPDYLATARKNLRDVPGVYLGIASEVALSGPLFVDEVVRSLRRHFPAEAERIEHAGSRARVGFLQYQDYLEKTLRPVAGAACAIGADVMNHKLHHEHLLPYDCDALDQLGREHVAKTRALLEEEAQRIDGSRDWRRQILDARRQRPDPAKLRARYAAEGERTRGFVEEKRIAPVPEGALEFIDTPIYKRNVIPHAAYLPPGAFDDDQTGCFYVTPVDVTRPAPEQEQQLEGHCEARIPLIALHEGYPGRHLQRLHANQARTRVRQLNDSSLFSEGWALYCEQMMYEEGYFADPATRLFQLKDLLWRACRVVVDVGLHTGRMTSGEAVAYLTTEAMLESTTAEREMRRHCLEPARPMSYLVGKLALLELRDEASRRLGARFSLHDFHAALLAGGAIQPSLVGEELWERLGAA